MEFVKDLRGTIIVDNNHIHDPAVRLDLLDQVIEKKFTVEQVSTALNCSSNTIYRQLKKRRNSESSISEIGRPYQLDKEARMTLLTNLNDKASQQKAASKEEFEQLVIEGVNATAVRRHCLPPNKLPSESCLRALKKDLNIRYNKGQTTTSARQQAQQDIRNYASVAVMHKSMWNQDRPELIFNFDATTYGTNSSEQWVVYEHKADNEAPITRVDNSGLELFIKSFFYHNAAGDLAPLVLVVMDETMDSDIIDPYQLPGGSWKGAVDSPAWVVFSKSRGGSRRLFSWFLETVIIPFVNHVRHHYHEAFDSYILETAYIHCDGEL